jgi:hypothetical protein
VRELVADKPDWQKLASALRELHRALMERARCDYERERGIAVDPGQLLQLLATDPYFAWLRSLSELMVDIDMLRDAEPTVMDEVSAAVRLAVENLVTPSKTTPAKGSFAGHYWPCVQDEPHVAMAHAGVKLAIASWPLPEKADAATVLHERHRLAEKARHRPR